MARLHELSPTDMYGSRALSTATENGLPGERNDAGLILGDSGVAYSYS